MNPDQQTVANKLNSIPDYREDFQQVFGAAPSYVNIERAIAAYERTQIAFDSPFDHFMAGDASALTAQQQRGWAIFNGQGPLHVVSRMESDPADLHRRSLSQYRRVGA